MRISSIRRGLIICAVYAVAMAYIESAVVVYLRQLLNESESLFPLTSFPLKLLRVEFLREFATIAMLVAVAALQSRRPRVLFAFFIYCFGIWDIFYYVWLKVLIGWPTGFLTWDVLFLIPCPWFGPVLSPLLVSLQFIVAALTLLRFEAIGNPLKFTLMDWMLGVAAALVIVGSYLWALPNVVRTGYPSFYPWWLFAVGSVTWMSTLTHRIVVARRRRNDVPATGIEPKRLA